MFTTREVIKTFYNALVHKLKKYRGNWDQNDPSATDYIKNRPFYEGNFKSIVIPKTSIVYREEEPCIIPIPSVNEFDVGKTYTVTWDEKKYECVAHTFDGINVVGNESMITGSNNTGEPFLIAIEKEYLGGALVVTQEIGEHTVTITTQENKIVKIPEKYLPESLGVFFVTFTRQNEDRYSCNKTLSEIKKASQKGNSIIVVVEGYPNKFYLSDITTTSDGSFANFCTIPDKYGNGYRICLWDYGYVEPLERFGPMLPYLEPSSDNGKVLGVVDGDYALTNAVTIDEELSYTSANPVQNKVVTEAINASKDNIALIDQVNGYTYLVSMRDGNLVSTVGVKSIKVTTMPTTTEYMHSAYFDSTGMVVTATCYDGTTKEITNYICPISSLTEGTTFVEITYIEAGIKHITTIPITVIPFDPATVLADFDYTDNNDETYTITGWKGTYNGEPSSEMIIPNYGCIIV